MDSFNLKQFLIENKLTENSKLNEIKATPKNTGFTTPKQLATDLVNQVNPGWEPGTEQEYDNITYDTQTSKVNPKFVKYLKSLPSDTNDDYSGTAFFDSILYNNHKYSVAFYIAYKSYLGEDAVVFELMH
jgi:hypothetical protein